MTACQDLLFSTHCQFYTLCIIHKYIFRSLSFRYSVFYKNNQHVFSCGSILIVDRTLMLFKLNISASINSKSQAHIFTHYSQIVSLNCIICSTYRYTGKEVWSQIFCYTVRYKYRKSTKHLRSNPRIQNTNHYIDTIHMDTWLKWL